MTQDSTFEFERKRNRPERYDRNVTENTLKAIKKIDKIRVDKGGETYYKEDERKESQGAERSNKGARAEYSHGQSSFCARQRAITYTAYQGQGFAKAVRGKSHGGMNILLPIFYIFKLKTLNQFMLIFAVCITF